MTTAGCVSWLTTDSDRDSDSDTDTASNGTTDSSSNESPTSTGSEAKTNSTADTDTTTNNETGQTIQSENETRTETEQTQTQTTETSSTNTTTIHASETTTDEPAPNASGRQQYETINTAVLKVSRTRFGTNHYGARLQGRVTHTDDEAISIVDAAVTFLEDGDPVNAEPAYDGTRGLTPGSTWAFDVAKRSAAYASATGYELEIIAEQPADEVPRQTQTQIQAQTVLIERSGSGRRGWLRPRPR